MKLMTKLISILLCLTALFCIFSTISWAEDPEESEAPTSESSTVPSTKPISIPPAPFIASLYDSSYGETLSVRVCLSSGSVKELHFKFETSAGVTLNSITTDALLKGVTLNRGGEFSFSVSKAIKGPGVLANANFKIPKGSTSTVKLVITKWIDGDNKNVTSSVSYLKRYVSYAPKESAPNTPQDAQPATVTGTFVYLPSGTVPTASLPQDLTGNTDNALTVTENTAEDIVDVFKITSVSGTTASDKSKITLKDSHTNIKVIIIVAVIMLLIAGAAVTVIIVSKKKFNNKTVN